MAARTSAKQQWLYITDSGLCLFETGQKNSALPYIDVRAVRQADQPLMHPNQHLAWIKEHCIGSRLNILLANSLYQLLLSDVPDVPDDEIRGAVELKAADLLRYDIDDALLDVILLPEQAYHGRMKMAFIIASQKPPLQKWLSELIKAGIRVNTIDVEITQLRNLSVYHQTANESGILHLTAKNSRLLLNYQSEMVLSRSFEVGLSSLLEDGTVQDGELELTVSQNKHSEIQLETLALEIRRSFDYYESQLGLGSPASIHLLCDSQHEHIAEELSERLGVRFSLIRPEDLMTIRLQNADLDPVQYYALAGIVYRETLQ